MAIGQAYATAYRGPVAWRFTTSSITFIRDLKPLSTLRPLVVTTGQVEGKRQKETVITRTRTRQVFVIPDPLAPLDTSTVRGDILNQKEDLLARRIGDDYIVIVDPRELQTPTPLARR